MAIRFAIDTVSKLRTHAGAATRQFKRLEVSNKPSDDATQVSLSNTRSRDDDRQSTLRNLSNAISYVDVAENAAGRVDGILGRLRELATQAREANLPEKASDIENEASTLLGELDSISSNTEVSGERVIDAGSRSFDIDTNSGDGSSQSNLTLSVRNIGLSRQELGLQNLDADSFRGGSGLEQTQALLDSAAASTNSTKQELSNARESIDSFASSLGLKTSERASDQGDDSDFSSAETLANSIREATKEVHSTYAKLTPPTLQSLLGDITAENAERSLQSSDSPTSSLAERNSSRKLSNKEGFDAARSLRTVSG